MTAVTNEAFDLLNKYGISLKKELKSHSVINLTNSTEDLKISNALYTRLIDSIKNSQIKNIRLPKIMFGVELEFVGSKSPSDVLNFSVKMANLVGDRFLFTGEYTHNDGTLWILGRDGSVRFRDTTIENPFGYELSTPTLDLSNTEHLETLSKVIDLIKTYLHGEVNHTCGTHIHIGFKKSNIIKKSVFKLLSTYSTMEPRVFNTLVPTSRRRNKYCSTTLPYLMNKYQKLSSRFCKFTHNGKCQLLHFEVRQLEGTLDLATILNWAILQATILYDILSNNSDGDYLEQLSHMNAFDILFHYNFSNQLISFFINRIIRFKSKTIQLAID